MTVVAACLITKHVDIRYFLVPSEHVKGYLQVAQVSTSTTWVFLFYAGDNIIIQINIINVCGEPGAAFLSFYELEYAAVVKHDGWTGFTVVGHEIINDFHYFVTG